MLPTGMGKTLTWLVAAQLEARDRLTIVIVPLNALILDLGNRLTRYGQSVHQQVPGTPIRLEGLSGCLLVSADRVVQDDVLTEIHTWEHRIVSENWRQRFGHLSDGSVVNRVESYSMRPI